MSKDRPSLQDRLASLQQGYFGANRDMKTVDPLEPTVMQVPLQHLRAYDRNPRQLPNTAYEQIKASVASRGFTGVLSITRRPGATDYMVAEGGNTVLSALQALYAETQDPRFQTITCLFEPWIGESTTLLAHLVENDARGDLLFIDRARAVVNLRQLLEAERGESFSARQLASLLRERGYPLDHALIVKMDYAVEKLWPVIPRAFTAGLGRPQVERIRKLEKELTDYLTGRDQDPAVISHAQSWYYTCLGEFDSDDWLLEPIEQAVRDYLAQRCDDDRDRIGAQLTELQTVGHLTPEPTPVSTASDPETSTTTSSLAGTESGPSHARNPDGSSRSPTESATTPVATSTVADDPKSLRARLWTLARQLAQANGLGECVIPCANRGCGFVLEIPEEALFAHDYPETETEAKRVTLWWLLSAMCEQWPYAPSIEDAPALTCLSDDMRIYPAILAVAQADEQTAIQGVAPFVCEPPSLDIAARRCFAVLDDRELEWWVQILKARQQLQRHCTNRRKATVWEL